VSIISHNEYELNDYSYIYHFQNCCLYLEMSIIKNHLQIELTIDAIIYRLRLRRVLEENRQQTKPDPETDLITNILMQSLDDDDRDRRAVDRPNDSLSPTKVSRYIDGIRSSRSTPNMAIEHKRSTSSRSGHLGLTMTKTDCRR
jgi:hypothetical protein